MYVENVVGIDARGGEEALNSWLGARGVKVIDVCGVLLMMNVVFMIVVVLSDLEVEYWVIVYGFLKDEKVVVLREF